MHESIQTIDTLLSFLADDERHQISSIQEKLGISREKLNLIINFLEKYNLIVCKEEKVKVNQQLKDLIKEKLE